MRTYGKIKDSNGNYTIWTQINQEPDGNFQSGYATTLIQVLLLSLGESPFYANYGIPAQRSVIQQVHPDYYVIVTQQLFAKFFASLLISKVDAIDPTYNVNIVTTYGTKITREIAI
jgi:hypothetical protein